MTMGSNKPENKAADRWTGMLFDSEPDPSEANDLAAEIGDSVNEQQFRRVAHLHLVHSLLLQASNRDEIATERRIRRVMDGVGAEQKVSQSTQTLLVEKSHNLVPPLIRYGVAAVLIISVAIFITQMGSNSAMATMDNMITAIDQAGDRTYRIMVKDSKTGIRGPRPNGFADMHRPQRERAILDGARLYLRGNDKFVLYRQTPTGQRVINGSDGKTRWLIRPRRPALVSNDPEAFRIPMPEELADLLTLDFKATLLKIRNNYKIKYLDDVRQDQDTAIAWMYLDARKRNNKFRGPRNIRIWAHSETGELERLEFIDIRLQGHPEPKKVVIELIDQKALSPDWFTHQAHHSSDAEIESSKVAPPTVQDWYGNSRANCYSGRSPFSVGSPKSLIG